MRPRRGQGGRGGAERIARFQGGAELGGHLADDMLRAAVERQVEIIGGAFAGLRRADPALATAIPDLSHIVAFRNILVHGYTTVDDRPVRGVVKRGLSGCRKPSRSRRAKGETLMVQRQRRRAVRPSRSAAGHGTGGGAEAAPPRSAGAIRPAPAGAEAAA